MPPLAFPFRWDGRESYREQRALRTDILAAHDQTEQRRALRIKPRRTHRFSVTALDAREAQFLASFLYAGPDLELAVPFWPHATRLTADAAQGATTLALDTTDRDFYAGQSALLFRDPFAAERISIQSVGVSSLTLTAGTAATWSAGSRIAPAHSGRLSPSVTISRPTSRVRQTVLEFELDPLLLPSVTGAAGAAPDVFTVGLLPDGREGLDDEETRLVDAFESPTAGFQRLSRRGQPVDSWAHPLLLFSRADVRALWTWYAGRIGALNPTWVPSFQLDVSPTGTIQPTDTTITIQAIDYTARLFPHEARRHLALIPAVGQVTHRRVTAAVNNGNGTETLTLDAQAGVTLGTGYGLVAVLRYARLAEDALEVGWQHPELAQAAPRFQELPWAVPTTV